VTKTQPKLNHFESESEAKSDPDLMLGLNRRVLPRIATMKLPVTLTALKANLSTPKSVEKTERAPCQM
jgi:hypothetical protein